MVIVFDSFARLGILVKEVVSVVMVVIFGGSGADGKSLDLA